MPWGTGILVLSKWDRLYIERHHPRFTPSIPFDVKQPSPPLWGRINVWTSKRSSLLGGNESNRLLIRAMQWHPNRTWSTQSCERQNCWSAFHSISLPWPTASLRKCLDFIKVPSQGLFIPWRRPDFYARTKKQANTALHTDCFESAACILTRSAFARKQNRFYPNWRCQ